MSHPKLVHIAIFASGGGSNAHEIIKHFEQHEYVSVRLLCTNNLQSGVWKFGADYKIPSVLLTESEYSDDRYLTELMSIYDIHLVVLAGYLKKIPAKFIVNFPHPIINIHPALLPGFGGKGMYGMKVHQAVIASGKKISGVSIHYVNEEYDQGKIIFQASLEIPPNYTALELQQSILRLEHKHYPIVIEKVCQAIHS